MSDVSGAPDVISDGINGLLVPRANTEALASAIERLARDSCLRERLGRAGRAYVEKHLAIRSVIPQYERVYERAWSLTMDLAESSLENQSRLDPSAITLVIPLRNEERSLERLFLSIRQQTRPPDEIILVDGGSSDLTVCRARELTVEDPGFASSRPDLPLPAAAVTWVSPPPDRNGSPSPTPAFVSTRCRLERLLDVREREPAAHVIYGNCTSPDFLAFSGVGRPCLRPSPDGSREGRLMRGPSIASCLLRVLHLEGCRRHSRSTRAAEDLVFMERLEADGCSGTPVGSGGQRGLGRSLLPCYRPFTVFCSIRDTTFGRAGSVSGTTELPGHYLLVLPFIALGLLSSPWWLMVPVLGFLARVGRSIWRRRKGKVCFGPCTRSAWPASA